MVRHLILLALFFPVMVRAQLIPPAIGETRVLDEFTTPEGWEAGHSDGVAATVSGGNGRLILTYDLTKAKGYAFTSKAFDLPVPSDFELSFSLSGTPVTNTIEFKLIDEFGNTWWRPFTGLAVSKEPRMVSVLARDVTYAWGPKPVAELKRISRIEIVMTSLEGGAGDLIISPIQLTNLTFQKTPFRPVASSLGVSETDLKLLTDGSISAGWKPGPAARKTVTLFYPGYFNTAGLRVRYNGTRPENLTVSLVSGKKEKQVFSDKTGAWDGRTLRWIPEPAAGIKIRFSSTDQTELTELEPIGQEEEIRVSGRLKSRVLDGSTQKEEKYSGEIILQFQRKTAVGALKIFWGKSFPETYTVSLQSGSDGFVPAFTRNRGNGGTDEVVFSDARVTAIRIGWEKPVQAGIRELIVSGPEAAGDANRQFMALAKDSKRGDFPRFFTGEMSYWTVSGVDGDFREALFNEDGTFETGMENLSLEPFLRINNTRISWADVTSDQALPSGYYPVPSVEWKGKPVTLKTELLSEGVPGNTGQLARYRILNPTAKIQKGDLIVAFRPFQVNPPWQNVNRLVEGGLARIRSAGYKDGAWVLNDSVTVMPLTSPAVTGAVAFSEADIAGVIASGNYPVSQSALDPDGLISGGMVFPFSLKPGDSTEVIIGIPWSKEKKEEYRAAKENPAGFYSRKRSEMLRSWSEKLDRIGFRVPEQAEKLVRTFKSNLAYIFINKDGPRIQPGSRSYLRSWIRDGSMTSAGLLQTGNAPEVKAFLDWFTPNVFPSGRVPCVVDRRGPDAVPENDSNGELLYAFAHYAQYTGDTAFVRKHWQTLIRAADFIISMRNERKTPAYTGTRYYGLVPESISHEGYSAKPMHSHWDNFFSLKGLKDASWLAGEMGDRVLAEKYQKEADSFRQDILASIRMTQAEKGISYIPGCAELGDFDATSTSIGLYPAGERSGLTAVGLHSTFDRYFQFVESRLKPESDWNDYTPYEIRNVHSFILLGQKERAFKTMDFLLKDQRPASWNQWAEIVWRNSRDGRWIGDMPHTWIGSDYLHTFRSVFVFEEENKRELILAAGIPDGWYSEKTIGISDAPTLYGQVSWDAVKKGKSLLVQISAGGSASKIIYKLPEAGLVSSVLVNGKPWEDWKDKEIRLPAGSWKLEIR